MAGTNGLASTVKWTRFSRSRALFIFLGFVIILPWLILSISDKGNNPVPDRGFPPQEYANGQRHRHASLKPIKQVVIRTVGVNAAGMGAILSLLHRSVVVAGMLGADFATFSTPSEHGYQVASYLGFDTLPSGLAAGARVCSLKSLINTEQVANLTNSWCEGTAKSDDKEAIEMRSHLRGCSIILDDTPWNQPRHLWKCTRSWTRRVITKALANQPNATRFITSNRSTGIGLHIRWGDMAENAPSYDPRADQRSIPIPMAARLLKKLRSCGVDDAISVYMENHNASALTELGYAYRIVDRKNDLLDLADLASNRIILVAISRYTSVAHQLTNARLQVVPEPYLLGGTLYDAPDMGDGTILRWQELLDIACVDLLKLI